MIGKHVNEFLGEEGRAAFGRNFHRMKSEGQVDNLEFDLPSKSSDARRVALSATAVTDEQGQFVETRTVTHDITGLKEAEEARVRALSLEKDNLELVESSRLKSLFLAKHVA